MEQFTSFVSSVAQSGMGGEMVQMFGVMPSNPDSWLQEKGQEVGREVMGKLMQAVYQADGIEPPADAIVSRSFTPTDMISNSGLGGGKMAHILAPLIAGIVSSITNSGVTNQIVNFATKRVGKTIEENSDSIAKHGESLGAMVIDGLSKIAQAQSGGAQNAQRGHNSHPGQGHGTRDFQSGGGGGGDINLDDITIDIIDENELLGMTGGDGAHIRSRGGGGTVQERGTGGTADTVIQAVMKPVARGVNSALKKPGLLQKLVDSVSGLVPLEKIKKTLKTTLYPQYQKACGVVAPHMQTFGGVAGAKIIEFLQKLTQVTGEAGVAQARDYCIQNTMRANENVERDLMSPIMQPFMSGVLWKLAQSGWKNQMAMGMVKKLFGSCLGGKMPQLTGGTGQAQGCQYQQNQSGQYQQNQGGAFMQG